MSKEKKKYKKFKSDTFRRLAYGNENRHKLIKKHLELSTKNNSNTTCSTILSKADSVKNKNSEMELKLEKSDSKDTVNVNVVVKDVNSDDHCQTIEIEDKPKCIES